MVFEGVERDYSSLNQEVNRGAHALASLGVEKGHRVALMSGNSDMFIVAMYAALKLGAIFVPLNPRSTAHELRHLLADSGAGVLLLGAGLDKALQGLDALEPLPQTVQAVSLVGAPGLPDLATLAMGMPCIEPEANVMEDEDAVILYTSGTTGKPKGALFDHHRMLWVGHSMGSLGFGTFDRLLHVAPMYHAAELVLFVFSGITMGASHVVMPAFEPAAVADALAKHRITVFLGVPTMYQLMLGLPDLAERDFSAWRIGFFGAAPMPPSAVKNLVATLPGIDFIQLCGQTEGGPAGMYSGPADVLNRPDATGRWPIPNSEMRLVDLDGNDVATGVPGEMIMRGETIMKGYWNNPAASQATLRDGWLHTGDVVVRDESGYLTIVDRMKDMIITGGRNVYSLEVENALAAHPSIAEVAVVGCKDEIFGESIVAIVTPLPGREVTLEGLRTFASDYIADYKLPRAIVIRVLPRNQSGKILKHVLRADLEQTKA
ncbi:class I adenylate-forming enzyme family protein [Arthrobacter sp. GMC3]|uniref:class I adenylate-forming enzyme family protein n=1 Tax=Arthrobacter sp. GMC3 TaxID=2058894 RepID=UPI000CE334C6|nr:AMP-binding protein [Arthrobacter sp. GMC3]